MKRWIVRLALATACALAAGALGACTLKTGGPAASTTKPAPKVGLPALGTVALDSFIPNTATTFSDGVIDVGVQNTDSSGKNTVSAVVRPLGGMSWGFEHIGSGLKFLTGAAEIGKTRVIVGTEKNDPIPGRNNLPFAATSISGASYTVTINGLTGGRSAAFNAVGTTGDPRDSSSQFVLVGGIADQAGDLLGDPSATDAFVYLSKDGRTWEPAAALPLPSGIKSAEAWGVTYAPSTAAFPGILVTGVGWADVTSTNLLGRFMGIVWQSTDQGQSWKIVSDDNFTESGRDMEPHYVAASGSTIVVSGRADVQGQENSLASPKQSESIEWAAGSDGAWHVISDGKSLRSTRSSMVTALVARPGSGFIEASEIYDTATGAFYAGAQVSSNPVVRLFTATDGLAWNGITDSIPQMDKAALVSGIAEYGNRLVFFGLDQQTQSQAYVVDASKVK